jgi:hypothetical protein
MDPYSQIVSQIIKDQAEIIGPVALEQARKVQGIEIAGIDDVKIHGNGKDILSHLVDQYSKLFGRASIEVCREAVHEARVTISKEDLPEILR